MGTVIMFASGKGGVGKSSISAALAVSFARRQLRTALIDADVGLRSLDLMLGMQDKILYELTDCLKRRCTLDEALVMHPQYPLMHLLVGGQDARPKDIQTKDLARVLKTLKSRYDLLLIDCPAGIGRGIKNFVGLADRYVLVATPDDICLRDTEKTARIILEETGKHPDLLLNRYDWELMHQGLISRPQALATAMDMPLLGTLGQSAAIYRGMLAGKTMAELKSDPSAAAIERIAQRLLGMNVPHVDNKENWRQTIRRLLTKGASRP